MAVDEIMHVKLYNDLPRTSENLWQLGAFSKGELYLSEHLPGTSSHLSPHNSDYMGLYISNLTHHPLVVCDPQG